MKTLSLLCFVIAISCSSPAGELKVGTVDMQRLLKEYYRADEVAKQLEARHNALFKELVELRLDGNRLLKEAHDLQDLALDTALSVATREDKKRSLELKLADLRAFELRYEETKAQREAEFQKEASLASRRILQEVQIATQGVSEKEGFNLILNANQTDLSLSDVVFCKNLDDLTGKVLASLNATKSLREGDSPKMGPEKSRRPDQ